MAELQGLISFIKAKAEAKEAAAAVAEPQGHGGETPPKEIKQRTRLDAF